MRPHFKFFIFAAALFISACAQVPQAEYKDAIEVAPGTYSAPMMFSRLKVDLPVGADTGTVSDFGWDERIWFVTPANRRMLERAVSQKELDRVFTQVFEGHGYDVVDTVDTIFDEEIVDEMLRTEYRIGAKIVDAKMDADVEDYDSFGAFIYGRNGVRGKLYLKVQWGVYDALRRRVAYETITEGTGEVLHADPEGLTMMINSAFEMAAHNLAANTDFHNLIVMGKAPHWDKTKKQDGRPLKYENDEIVEIPQKPLSRSSFRNVSKEARDIAVMVQGGAGHGSGFFITKDGHILTNKHVVGNAQRVRIITSEKQDKLVAQVLRTDPARDVALLKLEDMPENMNIEPRPIRTAWPAVAEEIYAVGAPTSKTLQDTVTRGIVSAHRKDYRLFGTNVDILQADVDIHGGNSGGPIMDEHGNIVAISVAGYPELSGLNFFIPIEDALKRLDIEIAESKHAPVALRP